MRQLFKFVEKYQGQYFAFTQQDIRNLYEEITGKKFITADVGMIAATIETVLDAEANPSSYVPKTTDCIHYQNLYERNPKDFFSTYFNQKLAENDCNKLDERYRCRNINDMLAAITAEDRTDQIALLHLTLELHTEDAIHFPEHLMLLLKHEQHFICCSPDHGIAVFSDGKQFTNWLQEEIYSGAMQHFMNGVETDIEVQNNYFEKRQLHGLLKVKMIEVEKYHYLPAANETPALQLQVS